MSLYAFDRLDESERAFWIAEWVHERSRCPACGGDPKVCGDAARPWFPQRDVCHAEMNTAGANRLYAQLHEDKPFHDGTFKTWAAKASVETPFQYDDGVRIWASETDLTPHDHFLGGAEDCEECQEVDGGHTL